MEHINNDDAMWAVLVKQPSRVQPFFEAKRVLFSSYSSRLLQSFEGVRVTEKDTLTFS